VIALSAIGIRPLRHHRNDVDRRARVGRATRTSTLPDVVRGDGETDVSVGALKAEDPGEEAPEIGEEEPEDIPSAGDLFDPSTTGRVIVMQNVVPILSTVGAYLAFTVLFRFVW